MRPPPSWAVVVVTAFVVVVVGFAVVVVVAFVVVVVAFVVVVVAFVVVVVGATVVVVVVGATVVVVVVGATVVVVVVGATVVVVVGASVVVVVGASVVVVAAASISVVWIGGLVAAAVHVSEPRPVTSDAIDAGPAHEMVWPAVPDFNVVLMLIDGSDTAFDCTGPVNTTDTLLLSGATVYAPVMLPPEKLTLSSDATWGGDGITRVIELMVSVIGMLGEPDWTSSVTPPPSTAGSGVSEAVTLTFTAPTIGHVTEMGVVFVSALASSWFRRTAKLTSTIAAVSKTASCRRARTRRDRLLICYFPFRRLSAAL
jgi:hypothetical protein